MKKTTQKSKFYNIFLALSIGVVLLTLWAGKGSLSVFASAKLPTIPLPVKRLAPAAGRLLKPAAGQETAPATATSDVPTPFKGDLSRSGDSHLMTPPLPGSADMAVSLSSARMWGLTGAGETVTVTINGTQMGSAATDDVGFFWTTLYNGDGQPPNLPGTTLNIYHNGALAAGATLRAITGQVDVLNDTVSGNISGLSIPISVTVYPGWDEPPITAYSKTVSTDSSGNFTVDFSGEWNFDANESVVAAYQAGSLEVHKTLYGQQFVVQPFPLMAVTGKTTPGTAITLTIYADDGTTVRKQYTGTHATPQTGAYNFSASDGYDLSLELGEIVEIQVEGGPVLSRTVDILDVNVDANADRVTGHATPDSVLRGYVINPTAMGDEQVRLETLADPTGVYTFEFGSLADILPGRWVGIYVADEEGDDLNLWAPAQGSVEVEQIKNQVSGIAVSPPGPLAMDREITLTLYSAAANETFVYSKALEWYGQYNFTQEEDMLPDIAPGDMITVESEGFGWQGIVEVQPITVDADLEADRFTGTVETPGEDVEVSGSYWESQYYPVGGTFNIRVTANSPFTATPAGFDVNYNLNYSVAHRTPAETLEQVTYNTDGFGVLLPANAVVGTLNPPGTAYTITVRNDGGDIKIQRTGASDETSGDIGWQDFWYTDERISFGDSVQVQSADGFSYTLPIPNMILDPDVENDIVAGSAPSNNLLYFYLPNHGSGFVPTNSEGQFIFAVDQLQSNNSDGDLLRGDGITLQYLDANHFWVIADYAWPQIEVNYAHEWIQGQAEPNAAVAITVSDASGIKTTLALTTDGYGAFQSSYWEWTPNISDPIAPGDWVTVTAGSKVFNVSPVGALNGQVDASANTFAGTLDAPWFAPDPLTVRCEVWEENGPAIEITDVDPDGGSFLCNFAPEGWDIQPGQSIAVRYQEPDGDWIINVFRAPQMRVNYGHNWVGGDYPAGHTIQITVTNAGGIGQSWATVTSRPHGGWDYDGFETQSEDWTPGEPALEAGDTVAIQSDDGYQNTLQIGEITGDLDIETGIISGTINAPWLAPQELRVQCHLWNGDGMPPIEVENVAAIDGHYLCDMAAAGWDVQPGWTVAVMYYEPDGDMIINTFEEPAPEVQINKWADGMPAAGGNFGYWIEYWNNGDAPADPTIITDTLPTGVTYITDTSGIIPSVTGNIVTWDFGALPPQSNGRFMLIGSVDAGASGTLHNEIEISAPYDMDLNNNQAATDHEIQAPDVDLFTEKWIHHGAPAPGYAFTYFIRYENLGATGSRTTRLIDTLPEHTRYVSFSSPDSLWAYVGMQGDKAIFEHPGLNGGTSGELLLTLHLSDTVDAGDMLTNSIVISTLTGCETGSLDNNVFTHTAWVEEPYLDIGMDKAFVDGVTVADHEIRFRIDYRNHSNTPAHNVTLTDWLPTGTTFVTSTQQIQLNGMWQEQPFPPISATGSEVTWDLETLDPAEERTILITLHIDPATLAGTVLTNTASLSTSGPNDYTDNNPDNDSGIAVITVRETGPNLMAVKRGLSYWENSNQLVYDFEILNIGTEPISGITITETYPLSTTLQNANLWWGGDIVFTEDASAHQARWQVNETLWPGNTIWGQLKVTVGPELQRGSVLTNHIAITTPSGDVMPEDNEDIEVRTTGPDLYVEKLAPAVWVEPGEILTYTLRYGNAAEREEDRTDESGTVYITDTLPTAMAFITATLRWCDGEQCPTITPQIVDDQLVFDVGWQGPRWENEIYLQVQVADSVAGGDMLRNTVEIASSNPTSDWEPSVANNTSEVTVTVFNPNFVVRKRYTSSGVAGTPITYTLTVTNTGPEDGTGVELWDTLPAVLSYEASDGTLTGQDVTWQFAELAADGDTATGWVRTCLPCIPGVVTNDTYGIAESDQGVTSTATSPVALTVIAPTLMPGFEQNRTLVESDGSVTFTDTSSTNGPAIATWAWDFGDDSPASATQNAVHSYTTEGTYTITLTITDTCGFSDHFMSTVTVGSGLETVYLPLVVRNQAP